MTGRTASSLKNLANMKHSIWAVTPCVIRIYVNIMRYTRTNVRKLTYQSTTGKILERYGMRHRERWGSRGHLMM